MKSRILRQPVLAPGTFPPALARERLERLRAAVRAHRSRSEDMLLSVVDAMEALFDHDHPDTLCLHHLVQGFASLCVTQKVGQLDGKLGRALAEFVGLFPPPGDLRGKPLPEPFPMRWL